MSDIIRAKASKIKKDANYRLNHVSSAIHLKNLQSCYDVIVIGAGLGGLTSANCLARKGYTVLLLEQHYLLGGLAQYFKRRGGHIFDISLHGFPIGMKKTLRKYWSKELADNVVQVKSIRFHNPQFELETTFTREDFTRLIVEKFGVKKKIVIAFYDYLAEMNFYDDNSMTTRQLFQKFFPKKTDVWRLLMEPITYANGSTLDEPAISYGIVFSNFMSKGVYIYRGGTDDMIAKMKDILNDNGVDIRLKCLVEKIIIEKNKAVGVIVNGQKVKAKTIVSNAGLHPTINRLVGRDNFSKKYLSKLDDVKVNSSSSQVYIGIRKGEKIPFIGDLVFTSTSPEYNADAVVDMNITSRTYSVYYPDIRPQRKDRYTIVASINSRYQDWINLDEDTYQKQKNKMIDETLESLENYIPNIRKKIDYLEAATPRSVEYYILSEKGTSFGTKFAGLELSQQLSKEIEGLYHTGSVGIIMSGWLGAANYGVIVSNEVDKYLYFS